ncbi:MAG: hypothetical protein QGH47_00840 [Candidatus Woesearchaeota archaeon]|jgi:GNAT superfamily N-acetyltransferase|nr:hypothetical protein [Candidatus Woesearchaeota archaeon]|tara:strand:- start:448 stop:948 length:501 start_codon:yes stop_codon:yes gene_type:complete
MAIDTVVEDRGVFGGVEDRIFEGGGREYTLSLLYRDSGDSRYGGSYAVVAHTDIVEVDGVEVGVRSVEVGNVLGRYFPEYPSPRTPSTEIHRIDVDEEHRRLGLATAMLDMFYDTLPDGTKITMRSKAKDTVRRLKHMLETVGFDMVYSWKGLEERKIYFITALRG